ncbi:serine/threonine protein kinase [Klebsiella quasipneumoniae]|uniref:serine/threonine protein kinase n=1 Tax=Klebsiella quasipneumoniae TaxID=1463165 RepID=UPI002AB8B3E6|nr:serine/threonine protein kinase [Klebsiella quasipneumoniae]MDZ2014940.1 serine/threonine protein kinase [Klebsiella quasipneumoniae]
MWLMKTLLTSGCTNQLNGEQVSTSWHYSNSPKNRKTALSPRHDWLHGGSEQKKDPLRIWFFPQ